MAQALLRLTHHYTRGRSRRGCKLFVLESRVSPKQSMEALDEVVSLREVTKDIRNNHWLLCCRCAWRGYHR